MALVGEAHIVVRAITDKVNDDIKRGFNGTSTTGRKAGQDLGSAFKRGFQEQADANIFTRISDGLKSMVPGAEQARDAYRSLSAVGYALGPAIASGVGGISAIIGALGALIGSAGTAAGALAAIGNAAVAIKGGLGVAKLALGGVLTAVKASQKASGAAASKAISDAKARAAAAQEVQDAEKALARTIQSNRDSMVAANKAVQKAQEDLNDAIDEGRKQLKDLAFQAEGSALDEKDAALSLEKARQNLAAVQDLPPNNQARQEALLAYQQADLAYREAKSSAADYAKQQENAAKTGVAGTKTYQDAAESLANAQQNQAKAARDAAQSQADAEERVARAKAKAKTADSPSAGSSGGGTDPFAGLNKYQKEFAQFLISLKPKLEELKLTAAQAFLPPLQTAITTLVTKAFPTVNKGVGQIATAMGGAAIQVANAITSSKNLEGLSKLFTSSSGLITTFGKIIGNVFGILLSVLNASAPLAQHLADAIADATKKLDKFFKSKPGKDGLTSYFGEAQRTLGQFGQIFGNIFKGISGIIKANFGAGSGGDTLLKFLIKATSGFASLNDAGKQPALRKYFQDVVKNAIPVLQVIGGIIKILGRMGASKDIGTTFGILKSALPSIQSLGDKLTAAGPALARLVVKFVDLFNVLQDSGALKIFLDTLGQIVGVFDDFAKSPAGNQILTLTGRVFAFSLAFTTAGKAAGFFGKVIVGDLAHGLGLLGNVGTAVGGVGRIGGALVSAKKAGDGMAGALIRMADSPNKFTKAIGNAGIKAYDAFGKVGAGAKTAASKIAGIARTGAAWAAENAKNVARVVADLAKAAASAVASAAKSLALKGAALAVAAAQKIATAAQWLFNAALDANPIGIIVVAIAALVGGLIYFFTQTKLGQQVWANFTKFLGEAFNNVVTFLKGAIDNIVKFFQKFGPQILLVIAPFIGIPLLIISHWNQIVAFFQNIFKIIVAVVTLEINAVRTVITNVIGTIVNIWNGVWGGIHDFFANIWNLIILGVRIYVNTVRTVITNVINGVKTIWNNVWGGIHDFFANIWNLIIIGVRIYINTVRTVITNVTNAIKVIWNGIWTGIGNFFHGIWDGITGAIRNLGSTFHSIFNGIVGFVKSAFGGVLGAVKTPINGIISLVNGAIRALNKLQVKVPKGVPLIGGTTFGLNIPTIPTLAKGGIVNPSPGGSIVNVAEAGRPERVTPLDANGLSAGDKAVLDAVKNSQGSNVTIHLYPPQGASNSEIASMVNSEITFRMRKGAVA